MNSKAGVVPGTTPGGIAPGTKVRVIDGLLRDTRGTIIRRASWGWSKAVPQYVVEVRGLERIIRADYLERVA